MSDQKALNFYLQALKAEQSNKPHEAVKLYSRAFKLDPELESRVPLDYFEVDDIFYDGLGEVLAYDKHDPSTQAADAAIGTLVYDLPKVPRDKDGFVQSFTVDQQSQYTAFFEKFGFVVIGNVLTPEQVNDTVDEVWQYLENDKWGFKNAPLVDRNNPSTWGDNSWPRSIREIGILGSSVAQGKMAWKNRENPKLYSVFKALMGRDDLWVAVDRYGIMRPTKGVPEDKLEPVRARVDTQGNNLGRRDRPEWRTDASWMHWDLNPWKWTSSRQGKKYTFNNFISENNGSGNDGNKKLQGLVTLTESGELDGGFITVPGFCNVLSDWAKKTSGSLYHQRHISTDDFVNCPSQDKLCGQGEKITARAGSLIVWSSEQPHCNFPNYSSRFRINQYIKMFPQHEGDEGTDERVKKIKEMLPEGYKPSELGSNQRLTSFCKILTMPGTKLFSLASWHKEQ